MGPGGKEDGDKGTGESLNNKPGGSLKESLTATMKSLVSDTVEAATGGPENSTKPRQKPQPQHRFLTRLGASQRKNQESTLMTAISQLALETNPDNIQSHVAILEQMLRALEHQHHEYVVKEKLDINADPEKSYMSEFHRKVNLAVDKQKKRLGITGEARKSTDPRPETQAFDLKQMEDDLNDHMTSASQIGSNLSAMSKGRAMTSKLKGYQQKIEAKGRAIRNVLKAPGIEKNTRAIAKASLVWSTIDHLRIEYQSLLEEACDFLEAGQMEEILQSDEAQWEWLTEVEARLEELQMLKDSPEKPPSLNDGFTEPNVPPRFGGKTLADFLMTQTISNQDIGRQLKEQEAKSKALEDRLAALGQGGQTVTQPAKTDTKSALRLPTCPPVKFTGEIVDYLPWKRQWMATMGKSYVEEVQLMQLKASIPARTNNLIGLVEIRTMDDFWETMDNEYLDYNHLARGAIKDIKSLDKKDPRFIQMMLKKIQSYKSNLDLSHMGHRVTSDEMIREEWLPIMPDSAKEDWLKLPRGSSPLWPEFEEFLTSQARACRERERLGLVASAPTQKECTRCKSKTHTTDVCRSQYCLTCRSWRCSNKFHKKQKPGQEENSGTDSYCGLCREAHPFNKHTKSKADGYRMSLAAGHKTHMQSASKCTRCNREIRDAPQVASWAEAIPPKENTQGS